MGLIKLQIDRESAIPIRLQLKGAIEHETFFGRLSAGSALPSVRDLAEQAGLSPFVDSIPSEKIAVDAAEPLGVPF